MSVLIRLAIYHRIVKWNGFHCVHERLPHANLIFYRGSHIQILEGLRCLQSHTLLILVFEVKRALNIDISRESKADYSSVFKFGGLIHLILLLHHLKVVWFLILHRRDN